MAGAAQPEGAITNEDPVVTYLECERPGHGGGGGVDTARTRKHPKGDIAMSIGYRP